MIDLFKLNTEYQKYWPGQTINTLVIKPDYIKEKYIFQFYIEAGAQTFYIIEEVTLEITKHERFINLLAKSMSETYERLRDSGQQRVDLQGPLG